ncbi:vacuolar protein sorting-associated protein [Anaeramoeba flamelloides]|uniref:Vacuolar protein sorting-associated protein n=1 Tax=Anaeramoeba flamelloides TaxID=1746091 RepID=A0ABQ8YFV0_9EUKA|nr:vacuolar protein sorting-associated protein [Anaeramoeba flamelloides]
MSSRFKQSTNLNKNNTLNKQKKNRSEKEVLASEQLNPYYFPFLQNEIEPELYYYRIESDLQEIVKKEVITATKITSKIILLGSLSGRLFCINHKGKLSKKKQITHISKSSIIQIDSNKKDICLLSSDGKIRIDKVNKRSQNTNQQLIVIEHNCKIKCFVPTTNFYANKSNEFIFGDELGKIYLSYEGVFGRTKKEITENLQFTNSLLQSQGDSFNKRPESGSRRKSNKKETTDNKSKKNKKNKKNNKNNNNNSKVSNSDLNFFPSGEVKNITISPDGQTIVWVDKKGIYFYDNLNVGKLIGSFCHPNNLTKIPKERLSIYFVWLDDSTLVEAFGNRIIKYKINKKKKKVQQPLQKNKKEIEISEKENKNGVENKNSYRRRGRKKKIEKINDSNDPRINLETEIEINNKKNVKKENENENENENKNKNVKNENENENEKRENETKKNVNENQKKENGNQKKEKDNEIEIGIKIKSEKKANVQTKKEKKQENMVNDSQSKQVQKRRKRARGKITKLKEYEYDFIICGFAIINNGNFVVLTLSDLYEDSDFYQKITKPKLNQLGNRNIKPEIYILNQNTFEEIYRQVINFQRYDYTGLTQYNLNYAKRKKQCLLISTPFDLIFTRTIEVDERIQWFQKRYRFKDALEIARKNVDKLDTPEIIINLGMKYLEDLMLKDQWEEIAKELPQICGYEAGVWEYWILIFLRESKLNIIRNIIPIKRPVLRPMIYEVVLCEFLKTNSKIFCELVEKWNLKIYDVDSIISVLEYKIRISGGVVGGGSDKILMETLAELYEGKDDIIHAVNTYLDLRQTRAIELITERNLYFNIQDRVVSLLETSKKQGMKILIQNYKHIPIGKVVKQLSGKNKLESWLHQYLDALYLIDPNITYQFHNKQFELMAKFKSQNLIEFLNEGANVNLDDALKSCEKYERHKETVWILWRMGNTNRALGLVMKELDDIEQAIQLAQTEDDRELWKKLVDLCIKNPNHLANLLKNLVNTNLDSLNIISRIPRGTFITGLKERLIELIQDFKLKGELNELTKRLLFKDSSDLMQRHYKQLTLPTYVKPSGFCFHCGTQLKNLGEDKAVIFFCGHSFHQVCLTTAMVGINKEKKSEDLNKNKKNKNKINRMMQNKKSLSDIQNQRNKEKKSYQERNKIIRDKKQAQINIEEGILIIIDENGEKTLFTKEKLDLRLFIKRQYTREKFEQRRREEIAENRKKHIEKMKKQKIINLQRNSFNKFKTFSRKERENRFFCVICYQKQKEIQKSFIKK